MIRFCDKDVYSVEFELLDRELLFSYFINGRRSNLVCVLDKHGKYAGVITYASLINSQNVYEAVQQEYVVLDENIWSNGRKFFRTLPNFDINNSDVVYLPVLDKEHNLLYFAYQDMEANQELRMLWELLNEGEGYKLNFMDLYPEYEGVTIIGCNELAWYFAKYLANIGMPFNVEGELWEYLGTWERYQFLDYKNLIIYAEGTWNKEENMLRYSLRSVSVEFECIDKIYEENLKNGWIKDAEGDFETLVSELKNKGEIVIVGTGQKSQDAYDLLRGRGMDIFCFFSSDDKECEYRLLGKPIMNMTQIIQSLNHPYFLECTLEHSAWGTLQTTDEFAYMGYQRNQQFFYLQDYIDIPENNLRNILCEKNIVLAGDRRLCQKLIGYFKLYHILNTIRYGGSLNDKVQVETDEICLFVMSEFFLSDTYNKMLLQQMRECVETNNIVCYTDYFSNASIFLNLFEYKHKYRNLKLKPKGILLGVSKACCGNIFFRDILDGFHDVLKMDESFLNDNLFYVCNMLAEVKSIELLDEFWTIYNVIETQELQNHMMPVKEVFSEKMKEMLVCQDYFTSQELFVMFHIAYAKISLGKDVDIGNFVLYWEPHNMNRDITRLYAKWLADEELNGISINIIRNACVRAGSGLKLCFTQNKEGLYNIWNSTQLEEKGQYNNWEQLDIKFEDLKSKTHEALAVMCNKLGIMWSDALLDESKARYKRFGLSNIFDLKPVYNNYEEYFTNFDRMRISLVNSIFQKKHGYPYISCMMFTKKEIQEMFLKEFKFEEMYNYINEDTLILGRLHIKRQVLICLRRARWVELTDSWNYS